MVTRLEDYEGAPVFRGRVRFEDDWYLLDVDDAVVRYFATALEELNARLPIRLVERPHISVIKGERPSLKVAKWGRGFVNEIIEFRANEILHHENGRHVWINCVSDRLCEMREYFSLPTMKKDGVYRVNYHLTLAHLTTPMEAVPRPAYRLSPATGIDAETLMQHL